MTIFPSRLKQWFHSGLKWTFFSVSVFIIFIAIVLNITRLLTPELVKHKADLEQWASRAVNLPVSIGKVRAKWHNFEPALEFEDVQLMDKDHKNPVLHVENLLVELNLIKTLWYWQLRVQRLILSGTHLDIYYDDTGKFHLKGLPQSAKVPNSMAASDNSQEVGNAWVWLLKQGEIIIQNVSIYYHSAEGFNVNIADLDFKIGMDSGKHYLAAFAVLQSRTPSVFKFFARFKNTHFGQKDFKADVYLSGNQGIIQKFLKYPALADRLKPYMMQMGKASIEIWGSGQQRQWKVLQAHLKMQQFKVKIPNTSQSLLIDELGGNFAWQRLTDSWSVTGDNLSLIINHRIWPQKKLAFRSYYPTNAQSSRQLLYAGYLRLDDIQALATTVGEWPKEAEDIYETLKPSGELYDVTVEHTNANSFSVVTQFKDLSMKPWQNFPGFSHVSGTVFISPAQGAVALTGHNTTFDFPTLFSHSPMWSEVKAVAQWKKLNEQWEVQVPIIDLNDGNMHYWGAFRLEDSSQHPATVDVLAGLNLERVEKIVRYLPDRAMSPGGYRWLSTAFSRGSIKEGTLVLRGPLDSFPFSHHQGHFEVDTQLHDVDLRYQDQWPALSHIGGHMDFENDAMHIYEANGYITGNHLTQVTADINSFKDIDLTLVGEVNDGNLDNGVNFLKATPLKIGKHLQMVTMTGPMQLDLKMDIPLTQNLPLSLWGRITTKAAQLQVPAWNIGLKAIEGQFNFTANSLTANHVTAELANEPAVIDIKTLTPGELTSALQFSLSGYFNTERLANQYKEFFEWSYLSGKTAYSATLTLPDDNVNLPCTFTLDSDLSGIQIQIENLYKKTSDQKVPLHAMVQMPSQGPLKLEAQYGDQLSASLGFDQVKGVMKFIQGEIALGGEKAHYPDESGLFFKLTVPLFNWQDWQPLVKKLQANASSSTLLTQVDLKTDVLKAFNREFRSVILSFMPQLDWWVVELNTPLIEGELKFSRSDWQHNLFTANLKRLYIDDSLLLQDGTKTNFNAAELPPLDIAIQDFYYQKKYIGALNLKTEPLGDGINIEVLDLSSSIYTLKTTGRWTKSATQEETSIIGQLDTSNMGQLLNQWNLTGTLVKGEGNTAFSFNWPGSPLKPLVQQLQGYLKINLKNGTIIHLSQSAKEEIGVGQLLNLFSLQNLVHHFSLNFSDLSQSGFSFTELSGDFTFNNGSATSQNIYLNGPVARIDANGHINYVKKNYDMQVKVSPYVTSNLPILATIAGGPLVGAATWVVNKLVSPGVSKAVQHVYHVRGTWKSSGVVNLPHPDTPPLDPTDNHEKPNTNT